MKFIEAINRKRKRCNNCIWWLRGFRVEPEKIGRCVKIKSGFTRNTLRDMVLGSDGVFVFIDNVAESTVFTSYKYGCKLFVPDTDKGKEYIIELDKRRKDMLKFNNGKDGATEEFKL